MQSNATNPSPLRTIVAQKAAESQQLSSQSDLPANTTPIKRISGNNLSVFSGIDSFQSAKQMAAMLANADFIPDRFRNNIPNCMLAIELANSINSSVIGVMSGLYNQDGKPAWNGKFVIAAINSSGRFQTTLLYEMEYDMDGLPVGCTAYAYDKFGNKLVGPKVTMEMVKAEGWDSNPKWTTMADMMFRYRSGTFFGNVYVPDILMGMKTIEEVEDMAFAQQNSHHPKPESDPEVTLAEALDNETLTPAELQPQPKPQAEAVKQTPMQEADTVDAVIEEKTQIAPVTKTSVEAPVVEEPSIVEEPITVEPINEVQTVKTPKTVFKPEDFETPANMEELEFLMIDLGLEMEIKDNGKGKSYAKAIGDIDEAIAVILKQVVGFQEKNGMFVVEVTEFVIKQQAEDLF